MFDLVNHTDTSRLFVINMKGPLLSVRVLTQPAGHPLSETAGCCGANGQPKVLTDGTVVHQRNSFTVLAHMIFKQSDIIFSHFKESRLQLCCACHLFKCANVDKASRHDYLHVYYVTSVCASHSEKGRARGRGGGGCGERSAQRLLSARWCDTEAGWAQI